VEGSRRAEARARERHVSVGRQRHPHSEDASPTGCGIGRALWEVISDAAGGIGFAWKQWAAEREALLRDSDGDLAERPD
jgi:hypothetical protein